MALNNINDKVILNLDDNEGLAGYFSSKEPGEECTMTITGSLDEQTSDQAVLSINKVSVEGYEDGKKNEEDGVPVMMIMAGNAKEKSGDSY